MEIRVRNEEPVNGFKKEKIVGLIKFVGTNEEFYGFAQDLAIKIYGNEFSIDETSTINLFKTTCTMYILGTVDGVLRNEIIFYKNDF